MRAIEGHTVRHAGRVAKAPAGPPPVAADVGDIR